MNSATMSIVIMVSTAWMLRMFDHQHYHCLTAQALVTQTKQEYLIAGIEAYVRAYYKMHGFVPPILTYPLSGEEIVLTLESTKDSISLALLVGKKSYRRELPIN